MHWNYLHCKTVTTVPGQLAGQAVTFNFVYAKVFLYTTQTTKTFQLNNLLGTHAHRKAGHSWDTLFTAHRFKVIFLAGQETISANPNPNLILNLLLRKGQFGIEMP